MDSVIHRKVISGLETVKVEADPGSVLGEIGTECTATAVFLSKEDDIVNTYEDR